MVLERLAAIDKNDGDFVGIKAPNLGIGVHIHLTPVEAAPLVQLDNGLLDNLAEMAALARIHYDLANPGHSETRV